MLSLPASPITLALPPHRETRDAPMRVEYHGLPIYVQPLCRDGVVRKITVSYRENRSQRGARQVCDYGKILLKRDYTPKSNQPLPADQEIPSEVIVATLDTVMIPYFLPKLFRKCPELLRADLQWSLLGPYALSQLHQMSNLKRKTKESQNEAMDLMVQRWGKLPLSDILPERCAADLLVLSETKAMECRNVLRQIFGGVYANVVSAPECWARFKMMGRGKNFPAAAQTRKALLPPIFSDSEVAEIWQTCCSNLKGGKTDGLFLATLLMLLTGISVEEVCALRKKDFVAVDGYDGFYKFVLIWEVREQSSSKRKKGTSQGTSTEMAKKPNRRARGFRHEVVPISSPYRQRELSLGRLISPLLCAHFHGRADDEFLVNHPRNINRRFPPEKFDEWLENTFSSILQKKRDDGKLLNLQITQSVSTYLRETAFHNLKRYGYNEEELRNLRGLSPAHMDAQHYIGFSAPSEQVTMAVIQDRWIDYTVKRRNEETLSSKRYASMQIPRKITWMHIKLKIPPGTEKEVQMMLAALRGFHGSVHTHRYREADRKS